MSAAQEREAGAGGGGSGSAGRDLAGALRSAGEQSPHAARVPASGSPAWTPGAAPSGPRTGLARASKGRRTSSLSAFVDRTLGPEADSDLAGPQERNSKAPMANNQPARKSIELTTGAFLRPLQLADAHIGQIVHAKYVQCGWKVGVMGRGTVKVQWVRHHPQTGQTGPDGPDPPTHPPPPVTHPDPLSGGCGTRVSTRTTLRPI
jgi:hypothetical protein